MDQVVICPTITAYDLGEYRKQVHHVQSFTERLHIDLMDGDFAPTLSPPVQDTWWPAHIVADIHLMYRRPMDYLEQLIHLKPNMVVVQAEAELHHMHFAAELHRHDIKAGLCILQDTPVDNVKQIMHSFDHILVFSGHLGYHGGAANLELLDKVRQIKDYWDEIEIGWDGGINDHIALALVQAGVSVLNVGGFIQKAENPQAAYATLKASIRKD